ncbi:MAG TPA: hypothetical protein ENJ53_03365 [Phaeodactylibacter sp.]|nr:hypothetical protein [Phaeodactylibacter sp.]
MKKTLLIIVASLLLFLIGCKKDSPIDMPDPTIKEFGLAGTHQVATYTEPDYDYSTIYYPTDLSSLGKKSPIIFFASGWFSDAQPSTTYKTLLKFMASHGYTVVYTYEGSTTDPQYTINGYKKILDADFAKNNILPYADTTQIGVVGHSAGGGMALTILDYFSKQKNYGNNGRLLMTLDPWFAFDMDESDIKTLPSNTNVVFIKFGEGGNNDADGTDARIPLTEYYLLESIADNKKDYQIFANADHSYPKGSGAYSTMQGILKPLDALMDYTFVEQSERTRSVALDNGNDDPYANGNGIQVVKPKADYQYPCDGANTLIDYCAIVP